MKVFNMFITAVCFIFLIKLRWPKTKSLNVQILNENVDKQSQNTHVEMNIFGWQESKARSRVRVVP